MVWGLQGPKGFGEFFLDGDYVGWRERLTQYYLEEMSDAEKASYNKNDVPDYIYKVSTRFTMDRGPLAEHECPDVYQVQFNRAKSFGSLIILADRLLAVDEKLKAIIEGLEPNVHQFWYIRVVMPNGDVYPKRYFGLRIGRFLDSFLPGQSDEGSFREEFGLHYVNIPKKQHYAGLVLHREVIGSAHLWREKRLLQPQVCFSDSLKVEVEKAGLRLPKYFELRDV